MGRRYLVWIDPRQVQAGNYVTIKVCGDYMFPQGDLTIKVTDAPTETSPDRSEQRFQAVTGMFRPRIGNDYQISTGTPVQCIIPVPQFLGLTTGYLEEK